MKLLLDILGLSGLGLRTPGTVLSSWIRLTSENLDSSRKSGDFFPVYLGGGGVGKRFAPALQSQHEQELRARPWLNSKSSRNYRSAWDARLLLRGLRMVSINHRDSFLEVGLYTAI